MRRWVLALLVLPCACGRPDVVVASKSFTESVILGEIGTGLLHNAGLDTGHKARLGGSGLVFEALQRGEVDLYPEYTGTLRRELLAKQNLPDDAALGGALQELGLRMTKSLGFSNTYVLGMLRSRAEALGIRRISDLGRHGELRLGFSSEFLDRADGWPGLKAHYGLPQGSVRGLQHDLAYQALLSGQLDIIDLYSTDAEIRIYDLQLLEDDRGYFPRYDAVWLYRSDLDARALAALQRAVGKLDAVSMQGLNALVKDPHERRSEAAAAAVFLRRLGIKTATTVASPWRRLGRQVLEHLGLVAASLFAALLVALPLGVLGARHQRLGQGVLAVTGVLQTVPSLVLFVLFIPLVGLGFLPAVIALFLYSLLPMLRNTITGLTHVPRELLESSDALGLPRSVRLLRIELPMAAPHVMAGIKTAAVINVGTATLAAFIGAGGLGEPIFTGIQRNDFPLVLWGAVPAAILAILVQGTFEILERRVVSPGLRL